MSGWKSFLAEATIANLQSRLNILDCDELFLADIFLLLLWMKRPDWAPFSSLESNCGGLRYRQHHRPSGGRGLAGVTGHVQRAAPAGLKTGRNQAAAPRDGTQVAPLGGLHDFPELITSGHFTLPPSSRPRVSRPVVFSLGAAWPAIAETEARAGESMIDTVLKCQESADSATSVTRSSVSPQCRHPH